MTSMYLSTRGYNRNDSERTSATIELFDFIGPCLKRLILTGDFNPLGQVKTTPATSFRNFTISKNYCKDATLPNLKRLAFDFAGLTQNEFSFLQRSPKLEVLVAFREGMAASSIDRIFESYRGGDLKALVVGVSSKHHPLSLTRDWTPNDKVHIMEVDVPCSYYGDEREYALCQTWIRGGAIRGTLWVEHSRPMESWAAYTARWGSQ